MGVSSGVLSGRPQVHVATLLRTQTSSHAHRPKRSFRTDHQQIDAPNSLQRLLFTLIPLVAGKGTRTKLMVTSTVVLRPTQYVCIVVKSMYCASIAIE